MLNPLRLSSLLTATVLLSLALGAASCSAPGIRASGGFIQTKLSGEVALDDTLVPGVTLDTVDVEDSLGLDDASGSGYARLELDAGPVRVTGAIFEYSETGSGILTGNFGGINVGSQVNSAFSMTSAKTALTFDLLDVGPVRLSPGFGVSFFDVDFSVEEPATNTREDIDELLPVPMVFLQGELDFEVVGGLLDVGVIDAEIDELDGTFLDLEGMIFVRPTDYVELFAGYRWIQVDASGEIDEQGFDGDIDLQGWFLGGGIRF